MGKQGTYTDNKYILLRKNNGAISQDTFDTGKVKPYLRSQSPLITNINWMILWREINNTDLKAHLFGYRKTQTNANNLNIHQERVDLI